MAQYCSRHGALSLCDGLQSGGRRFARSFRSSSGIMSITSPILDVEALTLGFGRGPETAVVSGVSLTIGRNQVVGVIGESGSGKTLTALAILGLLPTRARIFEGEMRLCGTSLLRLSATERRALMGNR